MFTQVDPHIIMPVPVHVAAHRPLEQIMPAAQGVPQPPQLARSVCVFTQADPHIIMPMPTHVPVHEPLTHTDAAPHACPHEPQFAGSVWVFTHIPPHASEGATQPPVSVPLASGRFESSPVSAVPVSIRVSLGPASVTSVVGQPVSMARTVAKANQEFFDMCLHPFRTRPGVILYTLGPRRDETFYPCRGSVTPRRPTGVRRASDAVRTLADAPGPRASCRYPRPRPTQRCDPSRPMDAIALFIEFEHVAFVADTRLEVMLDERVVYDGSFASGFRASASVAPGPRVLETRIHVGVVSRRRRYEFTLPVVGLRDSAAAWNVRLEYSRLWGNFSRKLAVVRVEDVFPVRPTVR